VQYLNNVLEQDHRAIKHRVRASQHFRSFWGAWPTIAGYEAIHMIRKGQAGWSAALHRFILGLFAAAELAEPDQMPLVTRLLGEAPNWKSEPVFFHNPRGCFELNMLARSQSVFKKSHA
jgi:hypothetical protein